MLVSIGDCEHNSSRDVRKLEGNNYAYDRTLTTVLVELNATNYRFLNYGCNGSVPIVDHFTREGTTIGTHQAVHTGVLASKFLASLSALGGHV